MRRLLGPIVALCLLTGLPARAGTAPADPPLRFGVYPGNEFTFGKYAGAAGSNPVDRFGDLALDRMVELSAGQPFDVHLYADWRGGVRADLLAAIQRIDSRGLRVNLALKYVPPAGHDGDIAGFAAWVSASVRSLPQVDAWQITNEANVKGSPDTDGGATDPLGALIEGVKAAASSRAPGQLVGFNWFYRLDPVSDGDFWSTLGTRGGDAFRSAVDFAGVDIYAGTYIPPVYAADDETEFRRALEYVRHDLMPLAGLGAAVPIFVQETGYPTLDPVLRTEARQADALRGYIRATRGLNVGLLQWF
ncbi:MAG: hypothetical protein QOJ09_1076, partial [Actinomycetota bacterium]|nr:hypothetical protein [Actinomycetota bacterium]